MKPLPLVAALLAALSVGSAQSPRDDYRKNYQAWRQTEPTLESDAGSAGGDLAARVQRASAAARAYIATRTEYLESISREATDQLKGIQGLSSAATPLAGASPEVQTMVTSAGEAVARVADSFGTAADAGIRQLRASLQQERTALDAVSQAMANTRRSVGVATVAGIDMDSAREDLLRAYQGIAAARAQSAEQMRKSGVAWDTYYKALSNPPSSSSVATPPAKPVAPPKITASTTGPAAPEPEVVRPPTITPLPLLRYTGGWMFPSGGVFHGTQPDAVDLNVREENGHVTGTFSAQFKIPKGNATSPTVQFSFEGDLTANRNQIFNLQTADGVTGTIELIPGPAFNLLEINFQTEMRPNRVRSGNFLLVKK